MPANKQPPRRGSSADPGKGAGDKNYDESGLKVRDLDHVGASSPDTDPLDVEPPPPEPGPRRS